MTKYITIKRFAEISGYTDKATRAKIDRGEWLEGAVWKRAPDSRILMDIGGYESWVEGQEFGQHRKRA